MDFATHRPVLSIRELRALDDRHAYNRLAHKSVEHEAIRWDCHQLWYRDPMIPTHVGTFLWSLSHIVLTYSYLPSLSLPIHLW